NPRAVARILDHPPRRRRRGRGIVRMGDQGGEVSRRFTGAALIVVTAALALLAAGCGGGGGGSKGGTALPSSACSDICYQGSGKPDFLIASDLPLQGSG